jgi:hypothetical protein
MTSAIAGQLVGGGAAAAILPAITRIVTIAMTEQQPSRQLLCRQKNAPRTLTIQRSGGAGHCGIARHSRYGLLTSGRCWGRA